MDFDDPVERRTFFEVHTDLPREGPGNRTSTLRALNVVLQAGGDKPRRVVDVGCGPGKQTLDLVEALPNAVILAIDLHEPFLQALARASSRTHRSWQVWPVRADMQRLPLAAGQVDLLWCEGAAYIMGVDRALDAWWHILRPGGFCAFTDAVWLREDPPEPVRTLWAAYPGMGEVDACRSIVQHRGYELLDDFVLPPAAWWDDYYRPMEARIEMLAARHGGEAGVARALARCRAEIDVYRRYGAWYGYAFFVARKPCGEARSCRAGR